MGLTAYRTIRGEEMRSQCPNPLCNKILTIWNYWTGGDDKNYFQCNNCGQWGPEREARKGIFIDRRLTKHTIIDAKPEEKP